MAEITKDDVFGWFEAINETITKDELFARPVTMPWPMSPEAPYTFDAKTIGDVLDCLTQDRRYWAGHYTYTPLAWNVKAYHYDIHGDGQSKRTPELDDAWEKYLDRPAGQWVHGEAFSQAQEYYRGEWCAYPGDDQGDWKFEFWGRQGGHLCLVEWRGHKIRSMDLDAYAQFLASLVDDYLTGNNDLVKLYVGVKTADRDFTSDNASREVSHHYGFFRERWEEDRGEIVKLMATAIATAVDCISADYGSDVTVAEFRLAVEEVINGKEDSENI